MCLLQAKCKCESLTDTSDSIYLLEAFLFVCLLVFFVAFFLFLKKWGKKLKK